jgi:hypothetical protein
MSADFATELQEICAEAAELYLAQHPGDWWAEETGAFSLEDFRAVLALHLQTSAEQIALDACRQRLAGLAIHHIGQDWYSLIAPTGR